MIDISVQLVLQAALPILVYAVSVPAVAMRWRVVLHGVTGRRLPLGPLILASLASSFVNNVTAGPAGEACRVLALVRLKFATASRATAAAVYERLSEIPVIVLMVVCAVTVFGRDVLAQMQRPHVPLTLAIVVGVAVAIGYLARRPLARAWRALRDRVDWHSVTIDSGSLSLSASWSVAVWLLDITRVWLVARMFGVALGPVQAAALSAVTVIGGLAPTIGGLGVIEGGLIAALVAFGVPMHTAMAITAVERGISYGLATVAGAGALAALGGRELWTAARARAAAEESAS
ncbi:MAG: flippase-like domain-containing protein [Acidobacteriaceae bacterium]|jgi:uncharacterized membrane protein YbhN (UPF0104 family)|nr:flippase-like domain-containing protein [Acidobacteriaceae bacterium]